MFARPTTIRHTAHAIAAVALGAALLAAPAGARPVHGPLLHSDKLVSTPHPALVVDASSTRFHDSIAASATAAPALHDSIAATGTASGSVDRIAPPTLADSAYRDGSAGPVYRAGFSSNLKGFNSNPKVFAAQAGPTGSGSDTPWAAIGAGLLVAALGTIGIFEIRRRSHTPRRRAPHGKPSFGA